MYYLKMNSLLLFILIGMVGNIYGNNSNGKISVENVNGNKNSMDSLRVGVDNSPPLSNSPNQGETNQALSSNSPRRGENKPIPTLNSPTTGEDKSPPPENSPHKGEDKPPPPENSPQKGGNTPSPPENSPHKGGDKPPPPENSPHKGEGKPPPPPENSPPKEGSNSTLPETATTTSSPSTTTKAPINIIETDLCRRCSCNPVDKILNCSNRNLTSIFTTEEWDNLTMASLKFDFILLNNNHISKIDVMPEYPVALIDLSYNSITEIVDGAFSKFIDLELLNLAYNKLQSEKLTQHIFRGVYDPNYYQPMKKLFELNLSFNELHNINADLFQHLPNLGVLILSGNPFHVIDVATQHAIASLTQLQHLNLSYIQVEKLPDTILHSAKGLETLDLSGNDFKELPKALNYAKHLRTLFLNNNPLNDLENDNVFPKMEHLQELSISYSSTLKSLGSGAFSNLTDLRVLNVSHNPQLHYIDVNAFTQNSSQLEMKMYPHLEKLFLNNNNLTHLSYEYLRESWLSIKYIDISFNPWNCECDNRWLIETLIQQMNLNASNGTLNNTQCSGPKKWKNHTLIQVLNDNFSIQCENNQHLHNYNNVVRGLLIALIILLPFTMVGIILYRRYYYNYWYVPRCCRIGRRKNGLYNRADFGEELSI